MEGLPNVAYLPVAQEVVAATAETVNGMPVVAIPLPPARPRLTVVPNVSERPAVVVIPETPEDEFDRKRAEVLVRTVRAAGSIALKTEVKTRAESSTAAAAETSAYPTLMHAIHAAAKGDKVARKFVESNMRTEKLEIAFKSGNINDIEIEVGDDGRFFQFGQSMYDVFGNTLRWASGEEAIFERSVAETRNGMRMESARRRGLLRDNYFVVMSRYTDKLDDKTAAELGFFETKSCALQLIDEVTERKLVQQSAFVAGVTEVGQERHDIETIIRLGEWLGVDFTGKTDAEIIDTPLLIPKSWLPNGVVDLVKLYDQAAGGTFFGEDKPVQDYLEYREFCRDREESLELGVQAAVDHLLQEARNGHITDPETATERLHKLAAFEMIHRAAVDKTINPRVFGTAAAVDIERARIQLAAGDVEGATKSLTSAFRKETSSSCPSARRKKGERGDDDSDESKTNTTEDDEQDGTEACVIDTSNCYCCKYNTDGSSRQGRLTVKAYVDANKTYHCMRDGCGAWLAKNGKSFKGYIAKRAERLAKRTGAKPETEEAA